MEQLLGRRVPMDEVSEFGGTPVLSVFSVPGRHPFLRATRN